MKCAHARAQEKNHPEQTQKEKIKDPIKNNVAGAAILTCGEETQSFAARRKLVTIS